MNQVENCTLYCTQTNDLSYARASRTWLFSRSQWQHWYDSHRSNSKYFNNVGLYLYKVLTAKSSSWSWPLFGLVRWARGKCRASTCLCSTQWIRPSALNQKELFQIAADIYSVRCSTNYQLLNLALLLSDLVWICREGPGNHFQSYKLSRRRLM